MSSLLRVRLKLRKLAMDYIFWGRRILNAAHEIQGPCEVYVFGSYAKATATGASDVDILMVRDRLPSDCRSRGNIKARLEEEAKPPLYHPFEIHLTTKQEAETNPIYRSAIREEIPVRDKKGKASKISEPT